MNQSQKSNDKNFPIKIDKKEEGNLLAEFISHADESVIIHDYISLLENSLRLFIDAFSMYKSESYPSSGMLGIYAIEELVRGLIFFEEYMSKRRNTPKILFENDSLYLLFKSHPKKHDVINIIVRYTMKNKMNEEGTVKFIHDIEMIVQQFEIIRLPYLDFVENPRFSEKDPYWKKMVLFSPSYSIPENNVTAILHLYSVILTKILKDNSEVFRRLFNDLKVPDQLGRITTIINIVTPYDNVLEEISTNQKNTNNT